MTFPTESSGVAKLIVLLMWSCLIGAKSSGLLDSFYFDPAPVDQEVIEGSEVRLRCDVSNRRNITFNWLINGKQVANQSRRYQDGSDLVILRTERHLDTGVYTCIANNISTGIALRSTGAKLTVQWIDEKTELQVIKPENGELKMEAEVILKCSSLGEPEPVMDFYKNYARLFASDRIRPLKHRLRISSVVSSDEGIYSCKSRNSAGESDFSNAFGLSLPGQSRAGQLLVDTFSSSVTVRKGDNATMYCRFKYVETFWFSADKARIEENTKFSFSENGSLIVRNVTDNDQGLYFCSTLNSSSLKPASRHFAIRLQMAYLHELTPKSFEPRPLEQPISYVIPIHGRGEITCLAPEGKPSPTLRWENPYGQEIGNRSSQVKSANKTLVLTNLQEGHSGNYTCLAENMAGIYKYTVWIVTSVLPKISLPPLSTRAIEGSWAQFDCKYSGSVFPITTITWVKDDFPIDLKDKKFVQNGTALRINDVTSFDEGNFACSLNTIGYPKVNSPSARLYVEKQLKFRPIPVNTKLELHSKSSIPCRAEGKSTPTIKWFKGEMVSTRQFVELDEAAVKVQGWVSTFPDHVSQSSDGSLTFDGVNREDEGHYMCRASNEEQGYINASIYIQVVVRPKFKVSPKNTTIPAGSWVMLNCLAVGEPTPYLQWDKDGQIIEADKSRPTHGDEEDQKHLKVHSNGSLTIKEAQHVDSGRYGCTAGNSGGLERHEAYLDVRDESVEQGEASEKWTANKTAVVAIFSGLAYMIVVIVPTVLCILKAKKQLKNAAAKDHEIPTSPEEFSTMTYSANSTPDKKNRYARNNASKDTKQETTKSLARTTEFSTLRKSQFNRNQLNIIGLLGKGKYGDVYLAKMLLPKSKDQEGLTVIVKSDSKIGLNDLDHDVNTFSNIEHVNVARILHVCRKAEPMLVIAEHCEWGDLKHFLVAMRNDNEANEQLKDSSSIIGSVSNLSDLSVITKNGEHKKHTYANVAEVFSSSQFHILHQISVALQCATGMEYLSSRGLIHGDLASRNVLIDSKLQIKISNLALARDPYASEYEAVNVEEHDGIMKTELLPIRWMAPEVISNCGSIFSKCSDIWSYGVLVWEIFTFGKLPLEKLEGKQIMELARKDPASLSHKWPSSCPLHVRKALERCNVICPESRPSFSEVVSNLTSIENIV